MFSQLSFEMDVVDDGYASNEDETLLSIAELMEHWDALKAVESDLPEPVDSIDVHDLEAIKQEQSMLDTLKEETIDQRLDRHLGQRGNRQSNAIIIDSSPVKGPSRLTEKDLEKDLPWTPHPLLAKDLVPEVERQVNRLPKEHLLPPESGERYSEPSDCFNRLLDYSFSQGFFVVTTFSNKERKRYQCVHHGSETRNYRGLGEDRERWSKTIAARGCKWSINLSYRGVSHRSSTKA